MRLIQAISSILITVLCISHLASAASPTTSPAQPDAKWFLDRAAEEVPHVAMDQSSFAPAPLHVRCYTDLAQAYLDAKETAGAQKMIDVATEQYALLPPSTNSFGDPGYSIIWVMCKTKSFDAAER